MAYFRKCDKENLHDNIQSAKLFGIPYQSNVQQSNAGTPKQYKRQKTELMASGFKNRVLFDSCDNKSSLSLSCAGEQVDVEPFTPLKGYFSPSKNQIRNYEPDELLNTPAQERFQNFWLPNPESTHWKSLRYLRVKNTPLSKDFVRAFSKQTPKKDFDEPNDNNSLLNECSFVSPRKELSFGRDIVSSTPVSKTPISKQIYEVPGHPSELFEDDPTKAEFSNLFSNKSNNINNL